MLSLNACIILIRLARYINISNNNPNLKVKKGRDDYKTGPDCGHKSRRGYRSQRKQVTRAKKVALPLNVYKYCCNINKKRIDNNDIKLMLKNGKGKTKRTITV